MVAKTVRAVGDRKQLLGGPAAAVSSSSSAKLVRFASRDSEGQPPVLVLNLFYSGLAIAREMGAFGVRVIGLSSRPEAYGNFSRLCQVRFVPDSRDEPDALAEYLLQAASELSGAVIFPTRDFDLLFLDRFRHVLEPHYRLGIPTRWSLSQVLNKQTLADAAQEAGVPTPRTLVLRSEADVDRLAHEIGFPCVVKPVSSHQWRQSGNWERVRCRKAFLVNSVQELRNEYRRVSTAHSDVLLQEWIPGKTENIVVLGAYVGAGGTPLAYFTARKLVQFPNDFGTGCIVRSEAIPEILEPSQCLWRILGYRGMAEVEYKYDPRAGEYKLIEMNARHWDQHQLGRAVGVHLTWTAYCDLAGVKSGSDRKPLSQATWVAEDSLFSVVLHRIRRGRVEWRELFRQLRGPKVYGIFSWSDPKPFLHHVVRVMLPKLATDAWRSLKARVRKENGRSQWVNE